MITQLSEETINEYASEAQTTQQPTGSDFVQGVAVGKTIPAKWWNWLFNAVTKRIFQGKNDAQNMLTELQNVVTDAGLELDNTDNTQLTQAVTIKADEQIDAFVEDKRGYFIHWSDTPKPTFPEYWESRYFSVGDHYVNAVFTYGGGCPGLLAWREGTGAQRSDFKISINADGKGWSPVSDVHMSRAIVPTYVYHVTVHKFKGRYFLYIDGTISGSWQNGHAGEMFVSDDLTTWTSVFTIYYYHNNAAITSNSEYPSFGWSDDALYVMSKEGESASAVTKLRATYDGYNWTEIATGFAYPVSGQSKITVPYNGQKVIPYGANGFLWGCYAFDGTTFAPVVSDENVKVSGYNPGIFSSGKVYYYALNNDYCFIAPNLGAQAVAVQLSETVAANYMGRLVLNGTYIAFGASSMTNAYLKTLDSIKLVDDTGTVTDFPHPPRDEDAPYDYMPFEINGTTYCGKYKTTTDFEHWELMSNLPESVGLIAHLFDCADPHLLGFYDQHYNQTTHREPSYVSKNFGETWTEQEDITGMGRGTISFDDCCWQADYNTGGKVTYNSINRVVGNTLYLR